MSELLKLYVQTKGSIPIGQLKKLNSNLLKTYYRFNKENIHKLIFDRKESDYMDLFYDFLDDNDKKRMLTYNKNTLVIYAVYFNDNILKDLYLMFTEYVKNHLMYIDLKSKYSLDAAVKFYRYLDSDFLGKFENKIITHFDEKSRFPKYEYFAKSFIETFKKLGVKKYLDNYLTYSGKENNNRHDNINDVGKRMDFLLYMLTEFEVNKAADLLQDIDLINERDMFEILENYYSYKYLRLFIDRFPIEFYYKFPKLFLNFINLNDDIFKESNIPKEFMEKYGLYEKYEKYVEIIAKDEWERIKKEQLNTKFFKNVNVMTNLIYEFNYNNRMLLSKNFQNDVSKKIYEYYINFMDNLN